MNDEVASPCINVCKMDTHTALCSGCLRTLAEIAAWGGSDDAQRLSILAAVEKRRVEHDPWGGSFRGECER